MKRTITRCAAVGLASVAAVAMVVPSAWAAKYDVKDFGDKAPSAEQLIDSLKPEMAMPKLKTRGLKPVESAKEPAKPKAASLRITFAFGSAELTDRAKDTLSAVADALGSSSLRDSSFLIEGHSDSVGSAAYNLQLSEARARSVKRHLVEVLGVDGRRLQTVGRGKSDLLDRDNPTSAVNRRVQIVNLGMN